MVAGLNIYASMRLSRHKNTFGLKTFCAAASHDAETSEDRQFSNKMFSQEADCGR